MDHEKANQAVQLLGGQAAACRLLRNKKGKGYLHIANLRRELARPVIAEWVVVQLKPALEAHAAEYAAACQQWLADN